MGLCLYVVCVWVVCGRIDKGELRVREESGREERRNNGCVQVTEKAKDFVGWTRSSEKAKE